MLLAAFILGLLSSFHCVGMCGPLAMSIPFAHLPKAKRAVSAILYHLGRISTYTSLGLVFGLVGRHLFIGAFQQYVSIVIGVGILIAVLPKHLFKSKMGSRITETFRENIFGVIRKLLGKQSLGTIFLLGMANGLLPCGMVYFALAAALANTSVIHSTLSMSLFGLGTLPLMLSVQYLGTTTYFNLSFKTRIKQLTPVFLASIGVLLILRGLNLGIPYISPFIGKGVGEAISCH